MALRPKVTVNGDPIPSRDEVMNKRRANILAQYAEMRCEQCSLPVRTGTDEQGTTLSCPYRDLTRLESEACDQGKLLFANRNAAEATGKINAMNEKRRYNAVKEGFVPDASADKV